jgi:hypothetical protein
MNAPVPTVIVENYNFLLTEKDEQLFLEYLKGDFGAFSAVPQHVVNLKKLSILSDRFRYVWDILLPPKEFMIQKYLNQLIINNEKLIIKEKTFRNRLLIINYQLLIKFWWLWYPYRWWVGVKGMWKLIVKS